VSWIASSIKFTKRCGIVSILIFQILSAVSSFSPIIASTDEVAPISLDTNLTLNTIKDPHLFSSLIEHPPITITGDDELTSIALTNGWQGNGTEANPFIIEQISIIPTHNETLLIIGNTQLHFIIRESIFTGGQTGIRLTNVQNGWILNNRITGNLIGIDLYESENNHIIDNIIENNGWYGIALDRSNNNELIENHIESNIEAGIYLVFSTSNYFDSNYIANNDGWGIRLVRAPYNHFENNIVTNNIQSGIEIDYGRVCTLRNNTLISNGEAGIRISSQQEPTNCEIRGNVIISNTVGIQLEHSNDNEIKENRIEEAGDTGISLRYANNNTIEDNEIIESLGFGIAFLGSWDNIIRRNNFIHNRCLIDYYDECSQAYSDSVNEISHNFWDDWTNPDQNYDCIVDNPYILEGAREFDFAPLTIPIADHNSNIFCEFMEATPPIIKNNIEENGKKRSRFVSRYRVILSFD
jgi:parallel beta-helix repeat protein